MPGILKSIAAGLFFLSLVIMAFAVILRLLESKITFHPYRELESRPEEWSLRYEEVYLRPAGTDSIHGWFFPPSSANRPVFLIFHGNAGNISHLLEWMTPFIKRGDGALLFDYRGYGLSSGSPSEKAFAEDALAVWDYLAGEKKIEHFRIIPFGISIGAWPAAYLAARKPVGALVLEGAFTRGSDIARSIFGFLPVHLLMKNHWEVSAELLKVRVPVMILHGRIDSVVPFALGEKLARTVGPPQIIWWPVEGGGHLDLYAVLGRTYYERIDNFAQSVAANKKTRD